jgi:phosphate-selective porin OprO/OprP
MQRSWIPGALAAAMLAPVAAPALAADDVAAMRAELAAMQARLAELEGTAATDERAAAHLQASTDAALADAAARISYQTNELAAGHSGKKFFLASPDGNYLMNLGGQFQFRYIYNTREDSAGDDNLQGFQLRRFKLKGDGYVADPKLEYKFSVAFNRDSNAAVIEEAQVGYEFDNGLTVFAGRLKGPFAFDELMSSSRQLTVERSLVNEQFTVGFIEGVGVESKVGDDLRIRAMLNDGAGGGEGGNGDFNESSADFAVTARADFTIGENNAKDYSSWAGDDFGINLGAAIHHEVGQTGDGQATTDFDSFTRVTVDALYNAAGLSLFGAAYLETQDAADGNPESDPFGFLAQVGYNIDDTIEPFVRYEFIDPDTGGDEISVVTAGFNYYLNKHKAKFTVDGVFALDPLNGIGVSDGLGLQTDAADEDGQFALRAQFQLLW